MAHDAGMFDKETTMKTTLTAAQFHALQCLAGKAEWPADKRKSSRQVNVLENKGLAKQVSAGGNAYKTVISEEGEQYLATHAA